MGGWSLSFTRAWVKKKKKGAQDSENQKEGKAERQKFLHVRAGAGWLGCPCFTAFAPAPLPLSPLSQKTNKQIRKPKVYTYFLRFCFALLTIIIALVGFSSFVLNMVGTYGVRKSLGLPGQQYLQMFRLVRTSQLSTTSHHSCVKPTHKYEQHGRTHYRAASINCVGQEKRTGKEFALHLIRYLQHVNQGPTRGH